MSVPNRSADFSVQADRDYEDVLLYSMIRWDVERTLDYKASLDDVIESLVIHPELGIAREDIAAGLRSFPVGQHMIFHTVNPTGITLARLLHQRQSTAGQFDVSDDE